MEAVSGVVERSRSIKMKIKWILGLILFYVIMISVYVKMKYQLETHSIQSPAKSER